MTHRVGLRRAVLCGGLVVGGVLLGFAQEPAKEEKKPAAAQAGQPAAAEPTSVEAEAKAFLTTYLEAFNAHKAAEVAAMWSANGTHVDRVTGDRAVGRQAIQADLAASFQRSPTLRLSGTVDHVQAIRPDILSVEGVASTSEQDAEPVSIEFSALLVKEDGKWRIEKIEETGIAVPETAADALRELDWQIGDWRDESEGIRVDMKVRWSPSQAFLLRQFTIDRDGEEEQTGTQIIGWDPRAQHIRSWMFDADGGFGDGIWSKNGDEWYVKSSQTLADGRAASGTYIVGNPDPNTITVSLIGHEVEGEPMPSRDPVTLVRVESSDEAPKPEAAPPPEALPKTGTAPKTEAAPRTAPAPKAAPAPTPKPAAKPATPRSN